tara:strand:- start:3227 stop:3760 length:534 start_codon:yes stop_codon:yes gene_type:complete
MFLNFWPRLKMITGVGTMLVCLVGCSALQPIFTPKPTAEQAMDIVSTAVETTNLWWPITFAGFLALIAGIVNLVFLRGGAKLLMIGVVLAMTPPIIDKVATQLTPWISILAGITGLALLGVVFGRWYGRKDIIKRAEERATYIKGNGTKSLTKGQTADVLRHLGDVNFKADYPVKGE